MRILIKERDLMQMLEYIHSTLQEVQNGVIDDDMILTSFNFIEEIRENTQEN